MFDETLRRVEPRYRRQCESRFEIRYSTQKPSMDTLSLDHAGRPLRDQAGHLKFRPGGHGVLIDNLNELQADLVFIKNIDNVQPDRIKPVTSHWKRALAGYLVRFQREVFRHLDALHRPQPSAALVDEAREFVRKRLHHGGDRLKSVPRSVPELIDRLHRPLRVCGVVPDTGEPGGGPFWVRQRDGSVSLQIVEASQVDAHDEQQLSRLQSSTHFNPVDLVCGVRDHAGRPFDLLPYVDPEAVNVTCKSGAAGRTKVLERPGLWNGAMARWNTLFVEVPIETFSPVKTVVDLLRDEHQPDGGAG
jgi:hypothetical protein